MALPLESLEIRNFKGLGHVKFDRVGRVNLITGKNNVGKTSVLEAISLWGAGLNPEQLFKLFERRESTGENVPSPEVFGEWFGAASRSFFIDPKRKAETSDALHIDFPLAEPRTEYSWDNRELPASLGRGFEMRANGKKARFDLTKDVYRKATEGYWRPLAPTPRRIVEYPGSGNRLKALQTLWSSIEGLDQEQVVLDALRLLEPDVKKFIVQNEDSDRVVAKVRMSSENQLRPISRMGDGMVRLADLALAAANAADGILLLDEIENGLHWSIFPRLWSFLFEISGKWNIQIFATTHSGDAVREFISCEHPDKAEFGVLSRLERYLSEVRVMQYDNELAEASIDNGFEVR
jgi:hypothetical protein